MTAPTALRKHLPLDELIQYRAKIEDVNYWRGINPGSSITDFPLEGLTRSQDVTEEEIDRYKAQLREEAYFQTESLIPDDTLQEMLRCIEAVKKEGFPVMFCLVYDVFYRAFSHFDSILSHLLGREYRLMPNFWVYFIEPSDGGKGFEPHRDGEFKGTIGADGLPTVLTLWISITDATPLNSCMYVLPKSRDPQYAQAIHDLKIGVDQIALEDIRALPTRAGSLSCWDQHIFHWGSRSSKRAQIPRISYAMYCQRGDVPPFDDIPIDLYDRIDFGTRLGMIAKGMYRYSYLSVEPSGQSKEVLRFLQKHMAALAP